jgi:hypothetical protein
MEYKNSVHLSRQSYPHWTGRDYNTTQIKDPKKMGLPANPVTLRPTLEHSFDGVVAVLLSNGNGTHASIIPLIGGMTLAQEEANGSPPEYSNDL